MTRRTSRFGWILPAWLMLTATAAIAWAADSSDETKSTPEVVTVKAAGEGLSKESAIKAALRDALEKGGKAEIFSDTKVENFQLIHDTILTRAKGIVQDYKILKGPEQVVGGTWKVWIEAQVSRKKLADNWGEVQNLLNQVGRPKILVWINERINGQLEEQSILETLIEKPLLKSGFDLVDRRQIEAVKQKEFEDAAAEDNVERMRALARDFGAQIFIKGTANADPSEIKEIHGVNLAMYNCDAQVKVYYTATGKLLAAEGIADGRGGAQGLNQHSPQAGKKALANISDRLVDSLYEQIMEQWTTAISAGGEITLTVQGLKFAEANKLKKTLADLEKVKHCHLKYSDGLATYAINAIMSAEALAEVLCEKPFSALLEITELKTGKIEAKATEQ